MITNNLKEKGNKMLGYTETAEQRKALLKTINHFEKLLKKWNVCEVWVEYDMIYMSSRNPELIDFDIIDNFYNKELNK